MRRAGELLCVGLANVDEIAARVGYVDGRRFRRLWRRHCGTVSVEGEENLPPARVGGAEKSASDRKSLRSGPFFMKAAWHLTCRLAHASWRIVQAMMACKLRLFDYASAPVSVNSTVPLILLPLLVLITGPAAGMLSAALIVVIVTCHELGHAFVCRCVGVRVIEVNVGFPYGYCSFEANGLDRGRHGLIAWGGVLAQAALLVYVLICFAALNGTPAEPLRPRDGFALGAYAWQALVGANAIILVTNLLPLPFFDGWRAWPVLLRPALSLAGFRTSGETADAESVRRMMRVEPTLTDDEGDDRSREVVGEFLARMRDTDRRDS